VSSKAQGDNHDDEDDWLLARERGQPGPAVSDETAARYAQLQSLIKDLSATPAGVASRVGWEQDVFAAIDAAEAEPEAPRNLASLPPTNPAAPKRRSPRSRRWGVTIASVATAAGVVILLAVYRHRGAPVVPTLAFEVQSGSRLQRGAAASVGDTLIVRGVVEGSGELRIYDAAGAEQARCTAPAPGCTVERADKRTTLQLTMPLRATGALHAVLFAAPLGGPPRGIDLDLEAAIRAGIARTPRDLEVH